MVRRIETEDQNFGDAFRRLVEARRGVEEDVDAAVAEILDGVRARGDAAVLDYTERFDRVRLKPETLRITKSEIAGAIDSCTPETVAALKRAARRIEDFHRRQLPEDISYEDKEGVQLGQRWTPLASVGLYVPGGTAAYPSSVLMNALPARVAGVARLAMVVPAPDGRLNPLILAAAHIAGISEAYRIGGAQAVGALAYGTATIPAVDKIVGPGNAYVAAAKRRVFGTVGIDMVAGPSEILVVADRKNDPAHIAADLISQAEHDVVAQSILITHDRNFGDAVAAEVVELLERLPRGDIARESWRDHGAIIVMDDLDDAPDLIDALAPEHLELAVDNPEAMAARVRHAGAIFLGRYTPEAIGDYVAGPNHVLPTDRSARFSSGLGVLDFMKRTTLVRCGKGSLEAIGPTAITLAEAEGLDAHALSIAIRLSRQNEP